MPRGVFVDQAIGISTDEFHRAKDSDVNYTRNIFPLLDLGMSRSGRLAYLRERGLGGVVKSSCVGCPYSGNSRLRFIRDTDPQAWTDPIEFDKAIRNGSPRANAEGKPLRGQFFIHRSPRPLDQADLDATRGRPGAEEDDPDGCFPFSCRSGPAATVPVPYEPTGRVPGLPCRGATAPLGTVPAFHAQRRRGPFRVGQRPRTRTPALPPNPDIASPRGGCCARSRSSPPRHT